MAKPRLPWAWFRAKETNCSLREKFEFGETAFQHAFAQVELWHLLPPHLPELQMAAYTCFRPLHLLQAPALTSRSPIYFRPPRLAPAGAKEPQGGGDCIEKKDALVHHSSLGFADSRVLGARYYDPEPSGSFQELGVLGAAPFRRRGRNQSWSLASSSSRKISGLPGVVFLQARALILSSLSVRARLGPGTRDPLVRGLQLDRHRLQQQQNTKKPKGLKVTASLLQLGQIMRNKIQKNKTTTVSCEEPGAKAEYKGWADT